MLLKKHRQRRPEQLNVVEICGIMVLAQKTFLTTLNSLQEQVDRLDGRDSKDLADIPENV
jgi:hypothetical protein